MLKLSHFQAPTLDWYAGIVEMSNRVYRRTLEICEQQESKIRLTAYYLWEQSGKPLNRDLDFWLMAKHYEGII